MCRPSGCCVCPLGLEPLLPPLDRAPNEQRVCMCLIKNIQKCPPFHSYDMCRPSTLPNKRYTTKLLAKPRKMAQTLEIVSFFTYSLLACWTRLRLERLRVCVCCCLLSVSVPANVPSGLSICLSVPFYCIILYCPDDIKM